MSAAHLVVDVEKPGEKMATVEPQHRGEIPALRRSTGARVVVTGLERTPKRPLDRRLVELKQPHVTLSMRHLEAVDRRVQHAHSRKQRTIRVLETIAENELIAHIAGEQFVAAGAGEDDLVPPLDLREQIIQGKDDRS